MAPPNAAAPELVNHLDQPHDRAIEPSEFFIGLAGPPRHLRQVCAGRRLTEYRSC